MAFNFVFLFRSWYKTDDNRRESSVSQGFEAWTSVSALLIFDKALVFVFELSTPLGNCQVAEDYHNRCSPSEMT